MSVHRSTMDAAFGRIESLEAENRELRERLAGGAARPGSVVSAEIPGGGDEPAGMDAEQAAKNLAALEALERELGQADAPGEDPGPLMPEAFREEVSRARGLGRTGGPRPSLHEYNRRFAPLRELPGMLGVNVNCPWCASHGDAEEMVASEAELRGPAKVLAVVICLRCGYTGCMRVDGEP